MWSGKKKIKVPPGFPSDFPTPSRSKLFWSFCEEKDGKVFYWLRFLCQGAGWEIERDLRREMSRAEWAIGPQQSGMAFSKNNWQGFLDTKQGQLIVRLWRELR